MSDRLSVPTSVGLEARIVADGASRDMSGGSAGGDELPIVAGRILPGPSRVV